MKKFLSFMSVLLLITVALGAMPETVEATAAGVKVTLDRDGGATLYFETLTRELFIWLSSEAEGDSTVTLLKDQRITGQDGIHHFVIGSSSEARAITLDLGGHTLAYQGPSNLFAIPYDGDLTVKNGMILYTCVGDTRSVFSMGGADLIQCSRDDASVPLQPRLVLENLNVYHLNQETGRIISCFHWMPEIWVKNSFLWTAASRSAVIDMRKSTQKETELVQWKGGYRANVLIDCSTVGTAGNYTLAASDACTFSISNSTLVSAMAVIDPGSSGILKTGAEAQLEPWQGKDPEGKKIQGEGFVYPWYDLGGYLAEKPLLGGGPEDQLWGNDVPQTGVSILPGVWASGISALGILLLKKRKK